MSSITSTISPLPTRRLMQLLDVAVGLSFWLMPYFKSVGYGYQGKWHGLKLSKANHFVRQDFKSKFTLYSICKRNFLFFNT